MAVRPDRVGYAVSVSGHVLLFAAGLIAFTTPTPLKLEDRESVPVEVVSDGPPEVMQGFRQAPQQQQPQRIVDRQTERPQPTEDPAETPIARERVQNTTPPPARPRVEEPAEPPPMPRPSQPRVAEILPPPQPRPQSPPRPAQPTAEQREELTERLAELQVQQRREEQRRQEQERQQAEQRQREEQLRREQEQRRVAEQRERERREREARERREREQREARERAERERQERANARQFDPNSIAAALSQNNDRRQATRTEATGTTQPTRTASLGAATGAAARLTGTELDAFRSQVSQCWNPPTAVADSTGLIPVIDVSFNQDGSINGRPQLMNSRNDPAFQAAANAAIRAIQRCAPYRLPTDKYDAWRDMRVRFDPKDMMR